MNVNNIDSKLLNAKELADELGVCHHTILRWHQDGIVPSKINFRRTIRFSLTDVLETLEDKAGKLHREKNK